MKRLAEEFGPDWAMQHIVPQVCLTICTMFWFLIISEEKGNDIVVGVKHGY